MSNILKTSIYDLYRNDPYVLDLFDQIDWTSLSVQFEKELDARISKEERALATAILNSSMVRNYNRVVEESVQAMTRQISDLLELVMTPNTDKKYH